MADIKQLVDIMKRLRGEDGCPWDREQDHHSLKRFLIEETYELIEAIEKNDIENIKEELGDVLLQVVFHSQIASENNTFTMQDVIDTISEKLLYRHPHVFAEKELITAKEVEINWEKSKKKKSVIDGVPKAMPSNLQAVRVADKASRTGFDWNRPEDVIDKIDEELRELKIAINNKNKKEIFHELGDMYFALSNLSRHFDIDPEESHRACIDRFINRFKKMEELAQKKGLNFSEMSLNEQEKLWQNAKRILKDS